MSQPVLITILPFPDRSFPFPYLSPALLPSFSVSLSVVFSVLYIFFSRSAPLANPLPMSITSRFALHIHTRLPTNSVYFLSRVSIVVLPFPLYCFASSFEMPVSIFHFLYDVMPRVWRVRRVSFCGIFFLVPLHRGLSTPQSVNSGPPCWEHKACVACVCMKLMHPSFPPFLPLSDIFFSPSSLSWERYLHFPIFFSLSICDSFPLTLTFFFPKKIKTLPDSLVLQVLPSLKVSGMTFQEGSSSLE